MADEASAVAAGAFDTDQGDLTEASEPPEQTTIPAGVVAKDSTPSRAPR